MESLGVVGLLDHVLTELLQPCLYSSFTELEVVQTRARLVEMGGQLSVERSNCLLVLYDTLDLLQEEGWFEFDAVRRVRRLISKNLG